MKSPGPDTLKVNMDPCFSMKPCCSFPAGTLLKQTGLCLYLFTSQFTLSPCFLYFSVNLFDSIIDVTVAYPETIPQNESDILSGNFPEKVHFYIKRHKALDIPNSKEGVDNWCKKVWKDKEEKLKQFYLEKKFSCKDNKIKLRDEKEIESLFKFAKIFWALFQISTIFLLIYAPIIRWYILFSICAFAFISKFGGMQVLLDSESENAKWKHMM